LAIGQYERRARPAAGGATESTRRRRTTPNLTAGGCQIPAPAACFGGGAVKRSEAGSPSGVGPEGVRGKSAAGKEVSAVKKFSKRRVLAAAFLGIVFGVTMPIAHADVGPGTKQCTQPNPSNPNCPNHH
jgi:hypothetical protein